MLHADRAVWSFGPFEFDEAAGQLRRGGVLLKLQDQPGRVLLLLLRSARQLVSRDEFREYIWPAGTLVDFEHGLNTAIKKLREALGDSPEHPLYIETVPRRGYRFVAAVSARLPSQLSPGLEGKQRTGRVARVPQLGVLAAMLLAVSAFALRFRPAPAAAAIRSLAVLPLSDVSPGHSDAYFADGMTEALVTEIAQISGLRVISRTSVLPYKNAARTLPKIARELGVDAVIEGSVARAGMRVRITVQLLEATTDRHLWAASYERDYRDELAVQDEVARDIALQVQMRLAARAAGRHLHSRNPAAQEAYLQGLYQRNLWTRESLLNSVVYFQDAIAADSTYAEAWAAMARSYNLLLTFGYLPRETSAPKAMAAAQRALRLDDTLSEAHAVAGAIALTERRWTDAETEFQRALSLNPNNDLAHQSYGYLLSALGRSGEAVTEMERAVALDPLSSNKLNSLGMTLYRAGRFDTALPVLRRVPDPDANSERRHTALAAIYIHENRPDDAVRELLAALQYGDKDRLGNTVVRAYRAGGYAAALRAFATGDLHELRRHEQAVATRPAEYRKAVAYALLGDRRRALDSLERSVRNFETGVLYLNVDERFEPFHSDPRFQAVLAQAGLRSQNP